MITRYFVEVRNGVVHNQLTVSRQDWSDVTIQPELTEVSEAVFATAATGATANADGTFTPQQAPTPERRLSKFAFLRLLTPTEYTAMFGQQSDPMLAYGVGMFNAAQDPFNIDDPLVAQMLDYCVSVGALTAARRAELWAAMEAAA
jgi:hypothetical protein